MPVYRVTMEERHNDYFEEIYHACREMFCTKVYEIEADNEEEARELAEEDAGTLLEEDWDYGDTHDSDFHESGESIDSEYVDTNVTIETLDEFSARYQEELRLREEQMERARRRHSEWLRNRTALRLQREIGTKPSWEV